MKFQPQTEQEIAMANLWNPGEYAFEVREAQDTVSKSSGNDMIQLSLVVYNDAGRSKLLTDYLVTSAGLAYKLRHCMLACGLQEKYEAGDVEACDFIGKIGVLKLGIDISKDPSYKDKNVVKDYVVEKYSLPTTPAAPSAALGDDEIPFAWSCLVAPALASLGLASTLC